MGRLRQFWMNAGPIIVLQFAVVVAAIAFMATSGFMGGNGAIVGVIMIVAFVFPYLFRAALVAQPVAVQHLSNVVAFAMIATIVFGGSLLRQAPPWFGLVIFGVLGFQWGCIFWLLSDPNMLTTRAVKRMIRKKTPHAELQRHM